MGRGVPFDAAHVIGNVAFCLAFGPAFVKALQRFETRLHVRWVPDRRRRAAGAAASSRPSRSPRRPTAYLQDAQNADGGFGGAPGQALGRPVHGLGRARPRGGGQAPRRRRRKLLDRARGARRPADAGAQARTILALAAAGRADGRPRRRSSRRARKGGAFAGRVNTTAFAILALKAAGSGGTARSVRWLERQQNPDGGFNFAGKGGQSGIDDTSAPLQALVAAGGPRKAIKRAARFLVRRQNPDGGFPLTPGGDVQRAVDRLGGPGPRRRGPLRRSGRSPTCAALTAPERRRPLLPHEHADAGVGDRPGARGVRQAAVPAATRSAAQAARGRRHAAPTADADAEADGKTAEPKPAKTPEPVAFAAPAADKGVGRVGAIRRSVC